MSGFFDMKVIHKRRCTLRDLIRQDKRDAPVRMALMS